MWCFVLILSLGYSSAKPQFPAGTHYYTATPTPIDSSFHNAFQTIYHGQYSHQLPQTQPASQQQVHNNQQALQQAIQLNSPQIVQLPTNTYSQQYNAPTVSQPTGTNVGLSSQYGPTQHFGNLVPLAQHSVPAIPSIQHSIPNNQIYQFQIPNEAANPQGGVGNGATIHVSVTSPASTNAASVTGSLSDMVLGRLQSDQSMNNLLQGSIATIDTPLASAHLQHGKFARERSGQRLASEIVSIRGLLARLAKRHDELSATLVKQKYKQALKSLNTRQSPAKGRFMRRMTGRRRRNYAKHRNMSFGRHRTSPPPISRSGIPNDNEYIAILTGQLEGTEEEREPQIPRMKIEDMMKSNEVKGFGGMNSKNVNPFGQDYGSDDYVPEFAYVDPMTDDIMYGEIVDTAIPDVRRPMDQFSRDAKEKSTKPNISKKDANVKSSQNEEDTGKVRRKRNIELIYRDDYGQRQQEFYGPNYLRNAREYAQIRELVYSTPLFQQEPGDVVSVDLSSVGHGHHDVMGYKRRSVPHFSPHNNLNAQLSEMSLSTNMEFFKQLSRGPFGFPSDGVIPGGVSRPIASPFITHVNIGEGIQGHPLSDSHIGYSGAPVAEDPQNILQSIYAYSSVPRVKDSGFDQFGVVRNYHTIYV